MEAINIIVFYIDMIILTYAGIGFVFGLYLGARGYGIRNQFLMLIVTVISWPWTMRAWWKGEPPFDK
jgi:hypothetical protein